MSPPSRELTGRQIGATVVDMETTETKKETGESPRAFPRIISVDDHTVEPPGVWQDRLPAKYRDEGPRIVRAP